MIKTVNNRYFEKNNEQFFYLADTAWSSFTNVSMTDWKYYLTTRKKQGFNVLQINIMPQWDRSITDDTYNTYPFEVIDNYFQIEQKDETYFTNAIEMLEVAVDMGFTPALVVLWCNYVEGTWAANFNKTPLFKKEDINNYCELVYDYFDRFEPIYIISGDTDFPNKDTNEFYELALNKLGELSLSTLKVLHVRGRLNDIPKNLRENKHLSFYYFQSGHNSSYMNMPYDLATDFYNMTPQKPCLNSEPCYEFMGYSRGLYGRFTREDVRRAAWQSVFSGATSGVTYGAHGVWSWHECGAKFGADLGESFIEPMCWRDALQLEGADDYSFLAKFALENNILEAIPSDKLINDIEEIRCIESSEKLFVYVPVSRNIKISGKYQKAKYLDLKTRHTYDLNIKFEQEVSYINQTTCINDYIIILNK